MSVFLKVSSLRVHIFKSVLTGISYVTVMADCKSPGTVSDCQVSLGQDRETLRRLLEGASFLLVPLLAECFGCVYCEASAYGVPSIGRDTGGVGQAIRPGINGFLLAEDGRNMCELAERIKQHLLNPAEYGRIAASSRQEFKQRLNWGTFAKKTLRLLESVRA